MRALDMTTSEGISVDPGTSVHALAALPSERGISGVPGVDADIRMIGIVSRANLAQALPTTKSAQATLTDPDDRTIGDRLLAELRAKNWVDIRRQTSLCPTGSCISGSPTTSRGRRG